MASYARLLANKEIEDGEKINVTVPTGNFGNILAAYYAKQMGTPIDKLICASNMNNVLTDFFRTGVYNRKRDFHLTMSPSMDILISSNLERLIYHIEGDSAEKTVMLMNELKDDGEYEIKPEDLRASVPEFYGDFASEDETADEIRTVYNDCGYVIDTHTAVASRVCRKYKDKTGDKTKTVIASTASPYKFTRSVMKAIGCDDPSLSDIDLTDKLSAVAKTDIPDAIKEIKNAEIRHKTICEVNEMQNTVLKFLGL